jgi:hypothetical protein
MRYFCTYFDHRYLARGLALYESLSRHCEDFTLSVLCMDRESLDFLQKLRLPNLQPIPLEELELHDHSLRETKATRSVIEYYFTCTASLILFLLHRHSEVDLITYLDADLYFYSSPEPLFEELGEKSIAITAHRFPRKLSPLEIYGIYNVGFLSFRRDRNGLDCLEWWRERCLEWCFDREEKGRFADQKYLEEWPMRFKNVIVLQHKGANLAPWNVDNYEMTSDGENVLIDEENLIFFHFHGLKRIGKNLFDLNLAMYRARPTRVLIEKVFAPYIQACRRFEKTLTINLGSACDRDAIRTFGQPRAGSSGWTAFVRHLLRGNYVVMLGDRLITFPWLRRTSA